MWKESKEKGRRLEWQRKERKGKKDREEMKIDREKKISGKKERKKVFCILTDVNTTFRPIPFQTISGLYLWEKKKEALYSMKLKMFSFGISLGIYIWIDWPKC